MMGLGGYLFWTAVAREISEKHIGHDQIKFLPIEMHDNGIIKLIKSEIFRSNPRFVQEFEADHFSFRSLLMSMLWICRTRMDLLQEIVQLQTEMTHLTDLPVPSALTLGLAPSSQSDMAGRGGDVGTA